MRNFSLSDYNMMNIQASKLKIARQHQNIGKICMNTGFLCVFKGKIQVKEPVLWHFLRSEVLYSKKDFEGAIKFVI